MAEMDLETLLQARKAQNGTALPVEAPDAQAAAAVTAPLSPEERQKVDTIKAGINLTASEEVLGYGAAAQKDLAAFSDEILSRVRVKDSGAVGELLGTLSAKINEFQPGEKSLLQKLFGGASTSVKGMMQSYEKLSTQVDRIAASLDESRATMMKDIAMFDGVYAQNLAYFRALQLYIVAGEEKLRELTETTLPKLRAQAASSSDPMAGQVVSDFEANVGRFERKIHDLQLSRMIAIQTAPQIRLIQNSDKDLVDRIQSAVYNTIPLWKNQMVIALGLSRQQAVIEQQRAVTDTTNALLQRNAEMLKQNTIAAAKENERSIVDIETVQKVNADLIETIRSTLAIQQEGRARRQQAAKELAALESQLKEALLAAGTGAPAQRAGQA